MYASLCLSPFELILNPDLIFFPCAHNTVVTFVPVVNNFKPTITSVSCIIEVKSHFLAKCSKSCIIEVKSHFLAKCSKSKTVLL